ncbi:MAG TPA: hypothetical protein VMH22_08260 [bacterium]|nr:hypothetical protein [bacterium]
MKNVLSLSLLTALLFSAGGCSKVSLEPLQGGVAFDVVENYAPPYDSGYPRIELSMSTEKVYPDIQRTIAADVRAIGPYVSVDIWGIQCPDVLYEVPGPASSDWPLDVGDGQYLCQITHGWDSDWYALAVTDSYLRVSPIEGNFTQTAPDLYWRHPVNSFAYICGTTDEDTWVYDDFLDSLRSRVNLTEFSFPDSGEIPYPCSSAGHWRNRPARYFRYQDDADYEAAGRVLAEYAKNVLAQRPGVGIMLIDWKNRRHTSWES